MSRRFWRWCVALAWGLLALPAGAQQVVDEVVVRGVEKTRPETV